MAATICPTKALVAITTARIRTTTANTIVTREVAAVVAVIGLEGMTISEDEEDTEEETTASEITEKEIPATEIHVKGNRGTVTTAKNLGAETGTTTHATTDKTDQNGQNGLVTEPSGNGPSVASV